jgi:predicted HTH domain antitoxin
MPKKIEIEYPDSLPDLLQESSDVFEREAKMAMAVKMFELKRISSGMAAEMVGMNFSSLNSDLRV